MPCCLPCSMPSCMNDSATVSARVLTFFHLRSIGNSLFGFHLTLECLKVLYEGRLEIQRLETLKVFNRFKPRFQPRHIGIREAARQQRQGAFNTRLPCPLLYALFDALCDTLLQDAFVKRRFSQECLRYRVLKKFEWVDETPEKREVEISINSGVTVPNSIISISIFVFLNIPSNRRL